MAGFYGDCSRMCARTTWIVASCSCPRASDRHVAAYPRHQLVAVETSVPSGTEAVADRASNFDCPRKSALLRAEFHENKWSGRSQLCGHDGTQFSSAHDPGRGMKPRDGTQVSPTPVRRGKVRNSSPPAIRLVQTDLIRQHRCTGGHADRYPPSMTPRLRVVHPTHQRPRDAVGCGVTSARPWTLNIARGTTPQSHRCWSLSTRPVCRLCCAATGRSRSRSSPQ